MEKKALRQEMLRWMRQLHHDEKKQIEKILYKRLFHTTMWQEAECIGITVSQPFEWDTKPIIKAAWNEGKMVVVPKCEPRGHLLTFYQIDGWDALEKGYANIMEPKVAVAKQVDHHTLGLLLVPGLIFDKNGYRIGFGGGYFDRLLVNYTGICLSILSNFQVRAEIPKEVFDIPIQYLLTETCLYQN